jgi:hypothetical protein
MEKFFGHSCGVERGVPQNSASVFQTSLKKFRAGGSWDFVLEKLKIVHFLLLTIFQ